MLDKYETVTLKIDKEAAGYLVDLLNSQSGGAVLNSDEPLGRVRVALDALRHTRTGSPVFERLYLVSLPTEQPYPNLARADDVDARVRHGSPLF
jgi:hypothetical protein